MMKIKSDILNLFSKRIISCLVIFIFYSLFSASFSHPHTLNTTRGFILSKDTLKNQFDGIYILNGLGETFKSFRGLFDLNEDEDTEDDITDNQNLSLNKISFNNFIFSPKLYLNQQHEKLYIKYCCLRIHLV